MKKFINLLVPAFLILFISTTFAGQAVTQNQPWEIDHVVIVVENLAKASADFTKLGFTVLPGGTHAGDFDHNALVPLADGSYLELYSPVQAGTMLQLQTLKKQSKLSLFTKNLNAIKARFIDHIASGEGLADFAISTPNLDLQQEIKTLQQQGLIFNGPILMERTNPNGQKIIWNVAVPKTNNLPFLIADETPRAWRLGTTKPLLEQNGVTGIASITIAVPNLSKSIIEYETLLNLKPVKASHSLLPNMKTAVFKLANGSIILVQTNKNSGPYQLTLYTTNKSNVGKFDPALTSEADINLIAKS